MIYPRTMPDAGDDRCNSATNFNESLRLDNPYLSSVQSHPVREEYKFSKRKSSSLKFFEPYRI